MNIDLPMLKVAAVPSDFIQNDGPMMSLMKRSLLQQQKIADADDLYDYFLWMIIVILYLLIQDLLINTVIIQR